ncbi:hypothetical protein DID74_01000 [Candidatus Marinamargulisbacteria bacterium SCGC AG-333-B06]|nr:hypothetical protein DID74_01000 [Candidatus Marinamargulisbacteria bacterium SCGC AG-333-B06]
MHTVGSTSQTRVNSQAHTESNLKKSSSSDCDSNPSSVPSDTTPSFLSHELLGEGRVRSLSIGSNSSSSSSDTQLCYNPMEFVSPHSHQNKNQPISNDSLFSVFPHTDPLIIEIQDFSRDTRDIEATEYVPSELSFRNH